MNAVHRFLLLEDRFLETIAENDSGEQGFPVVLSSCGLQEVLAPWCCSEGR